MFQIVLEILFQQLGWKHWVFTLRLETNVRINKTLYGSGVLLDTLYCFNLNDDFVNSLFNVMSDVCVKRSAPK